MLYGCLPRLIWIFIETEMGEPKTFSFELSIVLSSFLILIRKTWSQEKGCVAKSKLGQALGQYMCWKLNWPKIAGIHTDLTLQFERLLLHGRILGYLECAPVKKLRAMSLSYLE